MLRRSVVKRSPSWCAATAAKHLIDLQNGNIIGKDASSRRWLVDLLGGDAEIFNGSAQALTAVGDLIVTSPRMWDAKFGIVEDGFDQILGPAFAAIILRGHRNEWAMTQYAHPKEHVVNSRLKELLATRRPRVSLSPVTEAEVATPQAAFAQLAKIAVVRLTVRHMVAAPPERFFDEDELHTVKALMDDPQEVVRMNAARLVVGTRLGWLLRGVGRILRWRGAPHAFFPVRELPLERGGIHPRILTDPPVVAKFVTYELTEQANWAVDRIATSALYLEKADGPPADGNA